MNNKRKKIELPYDPAIPLLRIFPKEHKSGCTPMFIAASFTKAKLWKQPRFPTNDEWIKKMWYYIQWNSVMKKNENFLFCW
jgi:hypothetical protein